jgi:hypothetical protein
MVCGRTRDERNAGALRPTEYALATEIRPADLTNPADAAGLLLVLDSYARDETGGAALGAQARARGCAKLTLEVREDIRSQNSAVVLK